MLLQIKRWIEGSKGPTLAYTCLVGFLAGTALHFLVQPGVVLILLLSVVSFVFALFGLVNRSIFFSLIISALCAGMAFGLVRAYLLPDLNKPFVVFDGKASVVAAEVISDPEVRTSGLQAKTRVATVNSAKAEGVLLLQLPIGSKISYGDRVEVRGTIKLPQPFLTDQGKEFDYPNYLRAKGVGAVMNTSDMTITEVHSYSVLGMLYAFKHLFMHLLERTLPEPESSFLEGMLLGNRDALSGKLHDAFVVAGLVHIVVLSGYNLTLVADVFMKASTLIFPRLIALSASAASVVLFACMAGLDATVLRASIMALIVLFAKALRRPSLIMRSLSLACFVMVLYNPYVLIYDPSFILSFLATFGLVTLSGPVATWIKWIPERFSIREIAAATLATQAFVFPVLIFYTGKFSLIALPANLLALPLVPYAMYGGFIATCIGLLGTTIAYPFALVAWGLLASIIFIAVTAASIPYAAIDVEFLANPSLLLLYIVLVPVSLVLWKRHEAKLESKKASSKASLQIK